jgi:hypothetical protein
MLCADCWQNVARVGHKTCYRCHIHSVGFTYKGTGYGREAFHQQTLAEREREIRQNPNAERV